MAEQHRGTAGRPLEGWRDPFVFRHPERRAAAVSAATESAAESAAAPPFEMILGAGFSTVEGSAEEASAAGKRGCVLRYSAAGVDGPWTFEGVVAEGRAGEGRVWECPALLQVGASDRIPSLQERPCCRCRTSALASFHPKRM